MKKNFYIIITVIMALLVGTLIGVCVGMNLKTVNYNTGDTYKYYDQPIEDELKPWNV